MSDKTRKVYRWRPTSDQKAILYRGNDCVGWINDQALAQRIVTDLNLTSGAEVAHEALRSA